MKFSTKAIHIGQEPDPGTGAIIPPVFLTSTFALEHPEKTKGFEYTRHGNPNFSYLEKTLAALENAEYATVFSSGMAAAFAATSLLSSGDRVIGLKEVYGGTYRLLADALKKFGIDFVLIDDQMPNAFEEALMPPTKMVLFETPTNPLMLVTDIEEVSCRAKKRGVLTVVDNTFASPFFQHPLDLGADVVWHSTTKYIGGHSDLIGGALMTRNFELKKHFDWARLTYGLNPSPFDAWLTSRGVKTLSLRMLQHQKNALALAAYFENHPKVKKVHHPGLASHPMHDIAKKQMSGFSGMFSVEFDLSLEETLQLLSSFKLFSLAISLGGVESLVNHSATMSHVSVPKEVREQMGITDSLVRFSAGIEDTDDLLEDIKTL